LIGNKCEGCEGLLKDSDAIFITDCGCVYHFYCYQEREIPDLIQIESIKKGTPVHICPKHHLPCVKQFSRYQSPKIRDETTDSHTTD
jgi:hypothetical protein